MYKIKENNGKYTKIKMKIAPYFHLKVIFLLLKLDF